MIGQAMPTCIRRANSYKILADCYYRPDERLLEAIESFDDEAVDELISAVVRSAPSADDLERHTVDHSRLFVGPFKLLAPPYGSIYLEDGKFMGNSTLAVSNLYRQEGLDIVLKDAPDHISVELEFMHYLALGEANAHENSDPGLAESFRDKQESFLRTHLGDWIEPFTNNVETNAQTDFYKTLARITRQFVLEDIEKLSGDSDLE